MSFERPRFCHAGWRWKNSAYYAANREDFSNADFGADDGEAVHENAKDTDNLSR
jgi:hypothetical protein